jgi:hypothetical protein
MLVKLYWRKPRQGEALQPGCIGARKTSIEGRHTSYIERSNLSMRTFMRRFARLALGFSKKFENHCHMVALYTVRYNFVKICKKLKLTPVLASRVSDRLWSMEDVVPLIDARAAKPNRPAA